MSLLADGKIESWVSEETITELGTSPVDLRKFSTVCAFYHLNLSNIPPIYFITQYVANRCPL